MINISWGVYSITLLIGSIQGMFLAALLFSARVNVSANRALALFIVGVVALVTPYTLGFAGFFDAYRWLNFAPFYWELAFGPLVWLYVRQLGHRLLPRAWALHFLPVILQGSYYLIVWTTVPTALKEGYNDRIHVIWVLPGLALARWISYLAYGVATWRQFHYYQRWLAEQRSEREEYRLRWLSALLWAIGIVLLLDASVTAVDLLVRRLPYREEFPLYVLFAILVWILGLEGWRHAASAYPKVDADETQESASPNGPVAEATEPGSARRQHDWPALAARWIGEIERQGWYREQDVSLAAVARRLGTNTTYLSRALNEGSGQSFSDSINRLRVEAAKARLAGAGNVLDIAFDVGFASKASFNRVFKAVTGKTPSAFRDDLVHGRTKS